MQNSGSKLTGYHVQRVSEQRNQELMGDYQVSGVKR